MPGLEASIDEIVETVWTSTLGLPVVPDDPFRLESERGHTFGGIVQITGAWDGVVAVQCSAALARRATGTMMGLADREIALSDIQDTVGELANMVGGNVKALLPGRCVLGLPVVVEGADFRMRLPGSTQILQCAFRAEGEPFSVTVLRHTADG